MKDGKTLVDRVVRETSRSKKDLPTEAGQTSAGYPTDLIDTINQIFSLFSINYHNQFYSAFKDANTETQAKKLWLESLKDFSTETLLLAAKKAIKEFDYLPTIHKMTQFCRAVEGTAFPDVHSAYAEACNASSPKQNHPWSHPAVYYAGKRSNWYFLASNSQDVSFPVFKQHYLTICERIADGETLPNIEPLGLPETGATYLSKAENAKKLAELRAATGILSDT